MLFFFSFALSIFSFSLSLFFSFLFFFLSALLVPLFPHNTVISFSPSTLNSLLSLPVITSTHLHWRRHCKDSSDRTIYSRPNPFPTTLHSHRHSPSCGLEGTNPQIEGYIKFYVRRTIPLCLAALSLQISPL
ncbi:hypothetical protein B9Z19DRAFT_1070202 [Tuber borchii]|uniref:Uncharacterized protein n=1 Tax=Tuber borchii TaxID=42251 RepID=A0A2T7A9G7_TUBBO|nr:hypothetical protein B9Z19DRAFT_1070202 [Tuber borchii]